MNTIVTTGKEKLVEVVAAHSLMPKDRERIIEVNVFNERSSSNSRNFLKKMRVSGSSELKPVVITTGLSPAVPLAVGGVTGGGTGVRGHGGVSLYPNGSSEFSLKETSPHLGGSPLNKDKTSSTC
ncbi:hypothetical protein QUC31_004459 [Theobroma cacao]